MCRLFTVCFISQCIVDIDRKKQASTCKINLPKFAWKPNLRWNLSWDMLIKKLRWDTSKIFFQAQKINLQQAKKKEEKKKEIKSPFCINSLLQTFFFKVWFLCLMAYQPS